VKAHHVIPRLIYFQRKVAKEKGVAFWDTQKAMGGEGSMVRWYEKGLCSGDLTHPTQQGASILGDLMFKSLVTGYQAYASTHSDVPILE